MFNNEPLRAFFYRTRREPGSGAFQWCAARGVVSLGLRARVRVRAKYSLRLILTLLLNHFPPYFVSVLVRQTDWSSMIPEL